MSRSRPERPLRAATGEQGFTLVELMVTVAVLVIVSLIAAPSFNSLIRGNRLVNAGNELIATLQLARTQAVSEAATVSACATVDGMTCAGATSARWIVLSSKSGVVRDVGLHPDITVVGSPSLVAGAFRFDFAPTGFVRSGAANQATVSVCMPTLSGQNSVDVSAVIGRISASRRAAGNACAAPAN